VVTDETDRVLLSRRCPNELTKILPLLEPHRAELLGVVVESTYNWWRKRGRIYLFVSGVVVRK
jgi:hypothetical protein